MQGPIFELPQTCPLGGNGARPPFTQTKVGQALVKNRGLVKDWSQFDDNLLVKCWSQQTCWSSVS